MTPEEAEKVYAFCEQCPNGCELIGKIYSAALRKNWLDSWLRLGRYIKPCNSASEACNQSPYLIELLANGMPVEQDTKGLSVNKANFVKSYDRRSEHA